MILHLIAAGLLLARFVHHAVSGDVTRFLLKKLHEEPSEKAHNRFLNAVLSIMLVIVLWLGIVAALIVPGTPALVELAVGLLIITGTIAASVYRQNMSIHSLLPVAAGTLILAGNLI